MAFENFDRQQLRQMVIDHEKATQPPPMPEKNTAWMSAVLVFLGKILSSSSDRNHHIKTDNLDDDSWSSSKALAGGESEMTVSWQYRNSSNYSPSVGGNDWDW